MAWVIEKYRSLIPTRCAIVWFDRAPGHANYTVATFAGKEGEEAAERVLAELLAWSPNSGPERWGGGT